MKVYEMAAVTDCGQYYQVEYLTTSLNKDFETHAKFKGLNNIAANLIRESMAANSIVRIVKDFQGLEVMPSDLIIIKGDDTDSLNFYKKIIIQKARQHVTHQQAVVSGIMLYEYTIINNYLCDKGYFIHDDNREEVYLSILETGDDVLIDRLETYLNAKDEIGRASALDQLYRKLYKSVNGCTSIDEVDNFFNDFMTTIFAGQK
jgi:hypothetical protein